MGGVIDIAQRAAAFDAGGAGWTLAVIWEDPASPLRNVGVFYHAALARDGTPTEIATVRDLVLRKDDRGA